MVIIKIPYALSYRAESRITRSWCRVRGVPQRAPRPHVLNLAAVFGILTRLSKSERGDWTRPRAAAVSGERSRGSRRPKRRGLHAETPRKA